MARPSLSRFRSSKALAKVIVGLLEADGAGDEVLLLDDEECSELAGVVTADEETEVEALEAEVVEEVELDVVGWSCISEGIHVDMRFRGAEHSSRAFGLLNRRGLGFR